jgi:transcriptional regulator with XRE-family HTH domain
MTDKSYTNWHSMSDKALAEQIGKFIREKRMEQNKTQDMLAHAAGVSRSTVSLLEKGESVTLSTWLQVLRALDQLQVLDAFIIQQTTLSPIQLAKMELKKRKRARGDESSSSTNSNW